MRNCRACGAELIWARSAETGKAMPLDKDASSVPRPQLVAYNQKTGGCRVITQEDVSTMAAWVWGQRGATFHKSHFATCPQADQFRAP